MKSTLTVICRLCILLAFSSVLRLSSCSFSKLNTRFVLLTCTICFSQTPTCKLCYCVPLRLVQYLKCPRELIFSFLFIFLHFVSFFLATFSVRRSTRRCLPSTRYPSSSFLYVHLQYRLLWLINTFFLSLSDTAITSTGVVTSTEGNEGGGGFIRRSSGGTGVNDSASPKISGALSLSRAASPSLDFPASGVQVS